MSAAQYPHCAGDRGLGGSPAAAARVNESLAYLQRQVVEVVAMSGERGATGDEIACALGWDKYRVRPRTSELRKMSRIMDSQRRRPSDTGIKSIVWVLPQYSGPVVIGGEA